MNILTKEHAPQYKRDGITSSLLVAASTCNARYLTTSLVEMSPGGKQHLHRHPTEQSYYIIKGEGIMQVGEETARVRPGNTVFIPSDTPHGLINDSTGELVYLSAGSPPFGNDAEMTLWPLGSARAESS